MTSSCGTPRGHSRLLVIFSEDHDKAAARLPTTTATTAAVTICDHQPRQSTVKAVVWIFFFMQLSTVLLQSRPQTPVLHTGSRLLLTGHIRTADFIFFIAGSSPRELSCIATYALHFHCNPKVAISVCRLHHYTQAFHDVRKLYHVRISSRIFSI